MHNNGISFESRCSHVFISTGTAIPGEHSKSDSNMQTVLNGSKKSADNGSVRKKQTNVVPTEGSNETDIHDNHYQPKESSSSILLAGTCMCTPCLN